MRRQERELSVTEMISALVGGCIGLALVYGTIAFVVGTVVKVLFF